MTFSPDVAVILVYLLVLIGVGYWSSRRINDSKDYIIAGGRIRFPVLLGTLIGTSIGAASTMGKAGKAYEIGIGLFFASMAYSVGLILFGFMSPVLRRIRVWNIPDALFLRYGNGVRMTFAVILVFSVTALFGTQLIAVGLAITSIMGAYGITYTEAIVFAGVIMVLYTMMGGLLAVAYTDVIQMVIMIAAIGILLPVFVVHDVGGMAAASYLKPPPGDFWGGLTPAYIVSMVMIDLPFCLIDPSLWQRAAAADSAGSIKKGMFVTGGGIYILELECRLFRHCRQPYSSRPAEYARRRRQRHPRADSSLHACGVKRALPGGHDGGDDVHCRHGPSHRRFNLQSGYRPAFPAEHVGPIRAFYRPYFHSGHRCFRSCVRPDHDRSFRLDAAGICYLCIRRICSRHGRTFLDESDQTRRHCIFCRGVYHGSQPLRYERSPYSARMDRADHCRHDHQLDSDGDGEPCHLQA